MALLAETDESNVETEPRQQAGGAVTLPAKYEHLPLLGVLLLHVQEHSCSPVCAKTHFRLFLPHQPF